MGAGNRRRDIRRAFGSKASDALLDMDTRTLEMDRFITTWKHGGVLRRLWAVLTGRF